MSDVKTLCENLKDAKPPYQCPIDRCEKILKSFTGAKIHLYKFHNDRARRPKENEHFEPTTAENVIMNSNEAIKYAEVGDKFDVYIDGQLRTLNINDSLDLLDVDELENSRCEINNEQYSTKTKVKSSKELPCNFLHNKRSVSGASIIHEPSFRIIENYDTRNMPVRLPTFYRFDEETWGLMNKEVEYDMDDEDVAWLSIMNRKRKSAELNEISEDIFELLMDRLEKESYCRSQTVAEETLASIDENAVCCICNDGDCDDSNAILFCDECNLPVHQECYGIPFIPEGQWLCRRCSHSPTSSVSCVLCPNKDGAFKQTDDGRWAHVICALWIPEVGFSNPNFLEPIDSLQNIPRARWKLCCYICKKKNVGACIQCKKTSCYTAFHVTCAQNEGLFMEMKAVKANGTGDASYDIKKSAFCHMHTPEISFGKDSCSDEGENSSVKSTEGSKGMQTLTELSVPVTSIPYISPNILNQIISSLNIFLDQNFIERILSFWKFKRQSRGGAPLLRRLQLTICPKQKQMKTVKSPSDIAEVRQLIKLRQDFERVRLLLEMIQKREKMKQKLLQIHRLETTLTLQPFIVLLIQTLERLQDKDVNNIFAEPVDIAVVPDYLDYIKNPMDFSTMLKKIRNFKYNNFREFKDDFDLMIDNCLVYNAKDTIYYRIGLEMRERCSTILHKAWETVLRNNLDMKTGLLSADVTRQFFENKEDTGRKLCQTYFHIEKTAQNGKRHPMNMKETFHFIPVSDSPCQVSYSINLSKCSTVTAQIGSQYESDEENGVQNSNVNFNTSGTILCLTQLNNHQVKVEKCTRKAFFKTNRRLRSSVNHMPLSSTKTKVPQSLLTLSCSSDLNS